MIIETKVVYIKNKGAFSTADERLVKITLPRMPWEPKEPQKEAA